jgi:hypothetical protein
MGLREIPTGNGPGSPRKAAQRLSPTLTLLEAAALTETDPDALWEQIRRSRIPFTLVSARKDRGNSVLVNTEDLIGAGLLGAVFLQDRPAFRSSEMLHGPVRSNPRSHPLVGGRRPNARPILMGSGRGRALLTAAVGLVLVVALLPTLSRLPVPGILEQIGLTETTDRRDDRGSSRARVREEKASRASSGSTATRSRPGASKTDTSRSGSPVAGPSTVPQEAPDPAGQDSGSTSPAPGGNQVPPGIPSNCSRDVTAALSNWIQSVPDNTTLMFPMDGCYRIDGTLKIENRSGLTFAGNGTTLSGKYHFGKAGNHPHIGVYGSRNISFRSITVKGSNPHAGLHENAYQPLRQWEAAWEINGSDGVLLESVQAYDLFGDFVTIEAEWVRGKPVNSRNIIIRNSHFERNGRMGIAVTSAQNVTISNNYIGKVRHALLDLEPETPTLPIDNVRFTENRTGGVWLLWIANGGYCNASVSNIYVADNVMEADAGMPLFHTIPPSGCPRRGPFTIERNTLIARSSPYAAFDFTRVQDVIVRDNEVRFLYDHRTRVFVKLADSTRTSVLNNRISADPRSQLVFVTADPGSDYSESGNQRI